MVKLLQVMVRQMVIVRSAFASTKFDTLGCDWRSSTRLVIKPEALTLVKCELYDLRSEAHGVDTCRHYFDQLTCDRTRRGVDACRVGGGA